MAKKFDNILITAGTKGIGLAVAKAFANHCDHLWLTYASDHKQADQVASELTQMAPQLSVHAVVCDVTDSNSAQELLKEMKAKAFVPDLMIMNAGVTNRKSPFEITDEEWDAVFQGNVHFPVKVIREIAPIMKSGSAIIFTGSMMAIHPHSVSLSYGVTKSAVHALVTNLVKHLEPYGIRVVGIAPGFVDTEWQKNKPVEVRKSIEGKVASHRFAAPDEIGSAFKMVAENEYFNGDIISLSGGYSYK
ncbi:SDR family NAD(P)-dependent oxidoreductase [Porphyromonas sp.]|uniref:SDR family NAD(P)-dependent oxidoreductase n=1 Tax=Porphyromonas sp. TaxID=1924944 RepID=UPI0026DBC3C8|nr:SDR family oxidoreductase [Porphyromonas sp.]MDO4695213.1 SDR family oxidoreductase [Porphyromonas sp.]MDO4770987.1 SDR family oxidoreductase [Porphyromonas sp.]